jgi:tripartite-type tricarboxylate transporter receptor subunit TctC
MKFTNPGIWLVAALSLAALRMQLSLSPPAVHAQTPFYQGKTITIINGNPPGGTADRRMRAFMPFLKKYIPGEPTILAEYMAGAGGRKLANHMYLVAKPDGLTVGFPPGAFVTSAIMKETGVSYDIDKLVFLGSPESSTQYVFLTKKELGLNSLDKLKSKSNLRIGGQSVGHTVYIVGRLFAFVLGLKTPSFVTGYSGPELDAALLRGEIDARANIADTIPQRTPEFLQKGLADFHSILEIPKGEKHATFGKLPELSDLATSDRDRQVLALFRSLRLVGSPYILPPATPKDRVEILREAFRKVFKDPDFHKEYKKLVGDDPTPLTAEGIDKAIRELPRDASIVELFKQVTGADALPPG